MKSASDNSTLTISPALLAQLEAVAEEEHRPAAEVVREALERYLARSREDTAQRPSRPTPAEAAARMREQRKGTVLPDGVTIRDLIDYGRA